MYRSFDWSVDSGMERVFICQFIFALTVSNQGSLRIRFSFPQDMTWNVILWVRPLMLRKRQQVYLISPCLFSERSAFRMRMGVVNLVSGRRCFLAK